MYPVPGSHEGAKEWGRFEREIFFSCLHFLNSTDPTIRGSEVFHEKL